MAIGLPPAHGPTMTSVRPGASEGAHAAKLNTVLYHFYAKTVAVACESRAPTAPSAARANKWVRGCTAHAVLAEPRRDRSDARSPAAVARAEQWQCAASVCRCTCAHLAPTCRPGAGRLRTARQRHACGGAGRCGAHECAARALDGRLGVRAHADTVPPRTISACLLCTSVRLCISARCMRWRGRCLPRPCAVVLPRGVMRRRSMSRSRCMAVRMPARTTSVPTPRRGRCRAFKHRSVPWHAASPIARALSCALSSVGMRCRARMRPCRRRRRRASAMSLRRLRAASARAP